MQQGAPNAGGLATGFGQAKQTFGTGFGAGAAGTGLAQGAGFGAAKPWDDAAAAAAAKEAQSKADALKQADQQRALQLLQQVQGKTTTTTTGTGLTVIKSACEGHTLEYVFGFAIAAFLLAILLGMLMQYWFGSSDCVSSSLFKTLVFYSFLAAVVVAIFTWIAHTIYCKSK